MQVSVLLIIILGLAAGLAGAKCASRSISIEYKSYSGNEITVDTLSEGDSRYGRPLLTLDGVCTAIGCSHGVRCNTCYSTLRASDLPKQGNGTYGVFFDDEPLPFYKFSADWTNLGDSSWYHRNGWIPGCRTRVGCVTRGAACGVRDVSISAQGCYSRLYRQLNAENLDGCVSEKFGFSVPKGEIYGKDCRARPL